MNTPTPYAAALALAAIVMTASGCSSTPQLSPEEVSEQAQTILQRTAPDAEITCADPLTLAERAAVICDATSAVDEAGQKYPVAIYATLTDGGETQLRLIVSDRPKQP